MTERNPQLDSWKRLQKFLQRLTEIHYRFIEPPSNLALASDVFRVIRQQLIETMHRDRLVDGADRPPEIEQQRFENLAKLLGANTFIQDRLSMILKGDSPEERYGTVLLLLKGYTNSLQEHFEIYHNLPKSDEA